MVDNTEIKRLTSTVPEAGKKLGLGRNVTYDAVANGSLPSMRFGKRIVISNEIIRQILAGELVVGNKSRADAKDDEAAPGRSAASRGR